ncbi:MAG: DUF2784 domain-containing protein [Deltaproteobacteria bacterium HGW-Deltaproteobacteria-10]|nr:MAG: DUF2784 domain-containing protein [Deltaproteobacteria bacterium HGW-Deltaproteobacteria-10]
MYQLLADALVVVHFLFIVFVVIGGVFVIRRPRLAWVHLPAAVWGALVELCGWFCPLTPLENYLRQRGGGAAYHGDFIEYYLLPLIYPENLTATMQYIFGAVVIAVNLVFYFLVLRKRWMSKSKKAA